MSVFIANSVNAVTTSVTSTSEGGEYVSDVMVRSGSWLASTAVTLSARLASLCVNHPMATLLLAGGTYGFLKLRNWLQNRDKMATEKERIQEREAAAENAKKTAASVKQLHEELKRKEAIIKRAEQDIIAARREMIREKLLLKGRLKESRYYSSDEGRERRKRKKRRRKRRISVDDSSSDE